MGTKSKTNLKLDRQTSWTAKQILETEMADVQWLVKDILPQGFFFIAGRPKMGKSFMTLQLCASIVSGTPFFGFPVKQGRVLYISLEDNARRIKKRMRNMGLDCYKGLDNLEIEERWDKLNKGGVEALIKRLSTKKYVLAVMDTYAKSWLLKDNNDAVEATKYLSPIYELTRGGDFSFGFVDHHRKNNQFAGDVVDDMSGTGAKGGVADTIWGLIRERGKQDAKLMIASRDTEIDSLDLTFDKVKTKWILKDDRAVKDNSVQSKIIGYMTFNDDVSISKMSKDLNIDLSLLHRETTELVVKGVIIKGKKKGKVIPYSLVNNPLMQ